MKHILTILTAIALCSLPFTAQAQSEEDYLPKAGDLGLSVSANPLSQIATGVSPTSTQPLVSISGKYMVSDKSALFLNVGWIYNYNHNNYYANDDAALYLDPFSRAKVIDTRENQITGLNVSLEESAVSAKVRCREYSEAASCMPSHTMTADTPTAMP